MLILPTMRGVLRSPAVSMPAEATALIARMTTTPSTGRQALIGNLIAALKNAGVWPKLDAFYVHAAHDNQASRLNWISSSYTEVANGTITFTTDRGWAGDASTGYLDTGFNPATASSPNWVQNNACVGVWSRTVAGQASSCLGMSTGTGQMSILPRNGSNFSTLRVNDSATAQNGSTYGATVLDGSGYFVGNRPDANTQGLYRNSVALFNDGARPSAGAPGSANFVFGRFGAAGTGSALEGAAWHFGASLTTTEISAAYTALQTYMTAVGAA